MNLPSYLTRGARRLGRTKVAILGWLLICCVGHLWSTPKRVGTGRGDSLVLMRAPLPSPLGLIARHYWFAVRVDGRAWARWEVWQEANQNSSSWGHVHKNLLAWNQGVGGGAAEVVNEWNGERARAFATCLEAAAPRYADREQYRAWPGPNSNTFVDAMLRECGLAWTLDGTAIGKDYRGILGASWTSGGTGLQVETPLVGALLGWYEGAQVHVLSLSLGIDLWPPAIVTPFGDGRFGFAE